MIREIQVALGWWRTRKPDFYKASPRVWDRAFDWVYKMGGIHSPNAVFLAQAWRAGYFYAKRETTKKAKAKSAPNT